VGTPALKGGPEACHGNFTAHNKVQRPSYGCGSTVKMEGSKNLWELMGRLSHSFYASPRREKKGLYRRTFQRKEARGGKNRDNIRKEAKGQFNTFEVSYFID